MSRHTTTAAAAILTFLVTVTASAQEPNRLDVIAMFGDSVDAPSRELICRSDVPAPWLVPNDERIQERFDPACAAERRSKMRGAVPEGWIVVDSNSHAHLYMPWELMQDFLLRSDSSNRESRRFMYRKEIAAAGWEYELFWRVIDDSGREFRTLWQSATDDRGRARGRLPVDDSRTAALCRARAPALAAARSAFGAAEFDRFLYTVVAHNHFMAFNPEDPDAGDHSARGKRLQVKLG